MQPVWIAKLEFYDEVYIIIVNDMKKWLIFGGGVLTGVVLTFLFFYILSASRSGGDDGTTWFEKPGDEIEIKAFKVFQVLGEDAALVNGQSHEDLDIGIEVYTGAVYLLTNEDGKYYYDDEVVKVPEGKVARQVGIYRYQTESKFEKTVPIIQIMSK